MKRDSLYKILRIFKQYKDKKDFYKDYEYWFQGHKLQDINIAKRKITFDYGLSYYYSNDDYHTVFFTIKEDKK